MTSPAGVRRPAATPAARCTRRRRRWWWSITTCRPPTASKPNPDPESADADRVSGRERQAVRPRILRRVRHPPGHLPRHRPRAGLHPARHDDRVRRQPHRDAWRVRRARLRHRHLRGRARAGDADADAEQVEEHARDGRRQAAAERHRQGHHPRHHRRDRHRRRHRLCAGICRRGDPRAVDGRPHDGLQHVGRGRRQGRLHRAGREDLRLSSRTGRRRRRASCGTTRVRYWETLPTDDGAHLRPRDQARRGEAAADRHLGHQPRAGHLDHRPRAGAVRDRRREQAPRRRALAANTWA